MRGNEGVRAHAHSVDTDSDLFYITDYLCLAQEGKGYFKDNPGGLAAFTNKSRLEITRAISVHKMWYQSIAEMSTEKAVFVLRSVARIGTQFSCRRIIRLSCRVGATFEKQIEIFYFGYKTPALYLHRSGKDNRKRKPAALSRYRTVQRKCCQRIVWIRVT